MRACYLHAFTEPAVAATAAMFLTAVTPRDSGTAAHGVQAPEGFRRVVLRRSRSPRQDRSLTAEERADVLATCLRPRRTGPRPPSAQRRLSPAGPSAAIVALLFHGVLRRSDGALCRDPRLEREPRASGGTWPSGGRVAPYDQAMAGAAAKSRSRTSGARFRRGECRDEDIRRTTARADPSAYQDLATPRSEQGTPRVTTPTGDPAWPIAGPVSVRIGEREMMMDSSREARERWSSSGLDRRRRGPVATETHATSAIR